MDDQTLQRIVGRVAAHPPFLAWVFGRYVAAQGPFADDLAVHLGVSAADFARLALYRRPRAEHFEADVNRAAADHGADPYRLAAVIRFVDAAEALADDAPAEDAIPFPGPAGDGSGFLAAARARTSPRKRDGDGGVP